MTNDQHATAWLFADVWETIAGIRPAADCIVQGGRRIRWAEFDRAADAAAADLLSRGLKHQSKVALFVRNTPEFLIGVFASLKVGMVPVNTNFRYGAAEAAALWTDADADAVVFSGSLTPVVAQARSRVRPLPAWYWVDDGGEPCPPWATPFGQAQRVRDHVRAPWGRSPDDLLLLYTGGTTGAPKGVMWRQDDAFAILNNSAAVRYNAVDGIHGVAAKQLSDKRPRPRFVPCGPLVHGTGGFSSYGALGAGGAVVLLEGRSFDAAELLDVIDREQVTHISVVGEAHMRPAADLLDAWPDRWSLSSLRLITSSGMGLSRETRERLLAHCPQVVCVDNLGSSEVPTIALSRSTAASVAPAATFAIGPGVRVLDEDDRDVAPGCGEAGVLVVKGRSPLGYYKDAARTAVTFRTIDGDRWVVTGELATVDVAGMIRILGRGSTVINTGGEKVYTREVEDAILRQPAVADAVVVGIPDETLGHRVVAAVQPCPGEVIDVDGLLIELRRTVAGYKVPRQLHVLESIGRSESGKIDQAGLVSLLTGLSDLTEPSR